MSQKKKFTSYQESMGVLFWLVHSSYISVDAAALASIDDFFSQYGSIWFEIGPNMGPKLDLIWAEILIIKKKLISNLSFI